MRETRSGRGTRIRYRNFKCVCGQFDAAVALSFLKSYDRPFCRRLALTTSWWVLSCICNLIFLQLDICVDELQAARWMTRDQVQRALDRTNANPTLLLRPVASDKRATSSSNVDDKLDEIFVPPAGAIAHQLISEWLARKTVQNN